MATMRAAVLQKDRSLIIENVPLPQLKPGAAVVKVLAVQVVNFAADVISGDRAACAHAGLHVPFGRSCCEWLIRVCRCPQIPSR